MSPLRKPLVLALLAATLLAAGCELPPPESVQRGYRGTGMLEVYNPARLVALQARNVAPEATPLEPSAGPKASEVYKNVQVLGNLDAVQFVRLMTAITAWVSPEQGCAYCHAGGNFEEDNLYTKVVARRMLQMTQHLNADWNTHVAPAGVTCYTCHRGQPVPQYVWFQDTPEAMSRFAGWRAGQNAPARNIGLTSLPSAVYDVYLAQPGQIRMISQTALPEGPTTSTQHTEWTYGLMMHMSGALGVNCTYCHNSRSFKEWESAPPQRVTAWYGIRMLRDMNVGYLAPLQPVYPANRLGPAGDPAKANCATCHQGAYKPLFGANMLKDYPALAGPLPAAAPAAPAADATLPQRVLFEVDKTAIGPEGAKAIEAAAAILKRDSTLKVDLSGFADRTGNATANLDLAKRRAFAVRDALVAAGVPADRVVLKKPEFVIGGVETDARRVDILPAK